MPSITLATGVMAALFASALFAQSPPLQVPSLPARADNPQTPPPVMRVCADPNDWSRCSTWTWVNGRYEGWREWGADATMTVVSFNRDAVVIKRIDTGTRGPGHPGAGFSMVYRGTISSDGNSILDGVSTANNGSSGEFRAYWGSALQAHGGAMPQGQLLTTGPDSSLTSSFTRPSGSQGPAMHIPTKISECEAQQCGVWEFNGLTGTGRWASGAQATLSVERFGFDGITIRRNDYAGSTPGFVAVYTGRILGKQIEGEVTWSWPGRWHNSPKGTWAATVVEPANYTILDPNLACKPSYVMSSQEALERGAQAINAKNAVTGTCWLRMSAAKGNPTAQGLLAAILYKGIGVPVNLPEAAALAQKASESGNYVGERCLWLMYANGEGLPKDPAKAEYWRAKAQQDKLAAIQAEQEAEEEFKRQQEDALRFQMQQSRLQQSNTQQIQLRQNVQSLVLLGLFLGAFAADFDTPSGGSDNNDFEMNRYDSLDRQCRSGKSYACYQLHPFSSDDH